MRSSWAEHEELYLQWAQREALWIESVSNVGVPAGHFVIRVLSCHFLLGSTYTAQPTSKPTENVASACFSLLIKILSRIGWLPISTVPKSWKAIILACQN